MQTVLDQMNTLPGIVGSMVYDAEGHVLAKAFPALFDSEALASAAGVLLYGVPGLEVAAGAISTLDLRYGESRIVVRPIKGANLLLLCTRQANLQFLNISVGMAIPKIEKLLASPSAPPKLPAPSAPTSDPKAAPSDTIEGKAKELKGFEKAFLKMDSWMRK
ncbi:MAG: roadblock/LC7 domain-containing protein [Geothrix sp.]|nr:roadblock/LC7 domain-containing protein [Geothrix sp.]